MDIESAKDNPSKQRSKKVKAWRVVLAVLIGLVLVLLLGYLIELNNQPLRVMDPMVDCVRPEMRKTSACIRHFADREHDWETLVVNKNRKGPVKPFTPFSFQDQKKSTR